MPVVRLTAKERILIHLADFVKFADAVEVPPEMGQAEIAHATGVRVEHLRQYINPLLNDGSVRERTAHVKGHRRRLKVFDLTDSGRIVAARLREHVWGQLVRVRDEKGTRESAVGEVYRESKGRMAFGTIVDAAIRGVTVDISVRKPEASARFIERLSGEPRLTKFVGRHQELDLLTSTGTEPRFWVVRGIAGIGKTSLAAKACERLRGTTNLYWHRIRPWDVRETILADLGEFLRSMGRPGLLAVLTRGEGGRADDVLREDLSGTKSFLVFDDAHEATAEALAFLRYLKDIVKSAPEVQVVVLTRKTLPIYDRRDVKVSMAVKEIDLGGLDSPAVRELLSVDAGALHMMPLAERLGGHPLFLELLGLSGRTDMRGVVLKDIRRFIEEEIYSALSDAERTMMKVASLYEVPVPRQALLVDQNLTHEVLLSLQNRALLQRMGDETVEAHDTIRDFFASILSPAERRRFGAIAAQQLQVLAETQRRRGDWIASVHYLSNALRLAVDEVKADLFESLGDADEKIGDLPNALTAYGSARKLAHGTEQAARLRRKVAMALQNRGENRAALAEVDAGLAILGGSMSIEQGWLELVRCRIAVDLEEYAEAQEHGYRASQAFRAFNHSEGTAQALLELGRLEIDRDGGQAEKARAYLQDALDLVPAVDNEAFAAGVHMELARNLAWRALDVDAAMREVGAAESLLERAPNLLLNRSLLMLKGRLCLDLLADFAAARRHYEEAIALGRRIHSRDTIAFSRFRLAHLLFYQGHAADARREFEALTAEIRDLGYPIFAFEACWRVAECSMWLGDTAGFLEALVRLRGPEFEHAAESRPRHAAVLRGLELFLQGDREQSIAILNENARAAGRFQVLDETSPVYFAEVYVAAALSALGREDLAGKHLRLARKFLGSHTYRAWLSILPDAFRRYSDFLRTSIPPQA